LKEVKLGFLGFGTVAQGCAKHLVRNQSRLEREFGFRHKVVVIADTVKGSVRNENLGIDLQKALAVVEKGKKLDGGELQGESVPSSIDAIKTSDADIIVEATWTNLKDAEPGLSHIVTALESGKDVVTSNKGPIALAYKSVTSLAKAKRRQLRFEATVMSGTPVFNMYESGLAGAEIKSLRGILNGTTNYILTEMAAGKTYDDVLRHAQQMGYAEVDPTGDVEAYDPAAKITILANALISGVEYKDVERVGITGITTEDINEASRNFKRIKLIALASDNEDGHFRVSVKPTLVSDRDMLAHVDGVMNALEFSTNVQPDVTIIGPGAGGDSAGYGLLADILSIHKHRLASGK
jgi:homoserine dehydrogenase